MLIEAAAKRRNRIMSVSATMLDRRRGIPAALVIGNFATYGLGIQPLSQTFQSLTQPVDLSEEGPMFVAFTANTSNISWWNSVYNKPDVGFNHPNRWSAQDNTVVFNPRGGASGSLMPEDDPFYQMRGFTITQGTSTNGPSVMEAPAGQQLTLSARVYNFSLTHVPAGDTVYVSFFGQEYTSAGGEVGNSFLIGTADLSSAASSSTTSPLPAWNNNYSSGNDTPTNNWRCKCQLGYHELWRQILRILGAYVHRRREWQSRGGNAKSRFVKESCVCRLHQYRPSTSRVVQQ